MKSGRGGVQYEDLREGLGALAERGCVVEIRYDLFLNRGDKIQENHTTSFRIGDRNVVAGLEYGIEGMRQGGERRVRVGPHLAYREKGVVGVVPPEAVLEFHVTLVRVDCEPRDAE
jgi:FKBP-type peptidyl-prolyl cis-trans isomerase